MSDNEVIDRLRRIETKLTRFIAGESDQPPAVRTEIWTTTDGPEIEVNSLGVSVQALIDSASSIGLAAGEEILVCENGKPRVVIRVVKEK